MRSSTSLFTVYVARGKARVNHVGEIVLFDFGEPLALMSPMHEYARKLQVLLNERLVWFYSVCTSWRLELEEWRTMYSMESNLQSKYEQCGMSWLWQGVHEVQHNELTHHSKSADRGDPQVRQGSRNCENLVYTPDHHSPWNWNTPMSCTWQRMEEAFSLVGRDFLQRNEPNHLRCTFDGVPGYFILVVGAQLK